MTTQEITLAFLKGYEKANISQKQYNWLLATARRENVPVVLDGGYYSIYLEGYIVNVKQCKTFASGGSYVGSKSVKGVYTIEKRYAIRFTENPAHTAIYGENDLKYFRSQYIGFEVIKPYVPNIK